MQTASWRVICRTGAHVGVNLTTDQWKACEHVGDYPSSLNTDDCGLISQYLCEGESRPVRLEVFSSIFNCNNIVFPCRYLFGEPLLTTMSGVLDMMCGVIQKVVNAGCISDHVIPRSSWAHHQSVRHRYKYVQRRYECVRTARHLCRNCDFEVLFASRTASFITKTNNGERSFRNARWK
jgi:hypothetical protein